MERTLIKKLYAWKQDPDRKPLLLMGARQVGKTFLLKKFGKQAYESTVYLNFENNPHLCSLFEDSLEPKALLKTISLETGIEILEGKTFLIFDEVQECPKALNSLKYFCETAPHIHIAAAGSLLGVKLTHVQGFPVGKVQFLTLHPFSFFEFLQAVQETKLKAFLEEQMQAKPIPSLLHEKLLKYLKEYLFVGGMPEAILSYTRTGDLSRVREIHHAILNAYSLDFAKHAPKEEIMRISQVWNSIPSQLAKENKKFLYSAIRKGARAKEFEIALQWLIEAGLIYKVRQISTPKVPLSAYANPNIFKIYLVDVGLIGAMANLSPKALLEEERLFQEFKGALMENYLAQALSLKHDEIFYWTSEGKAEIDFLTEYEGIPFPIEVKSGTSSKKKSMNVYQGLYHPSLSIRCSPLNLRLDGTLLNCPLYLVEQLASLIQAI